MRGKNSISSDLFIIELELEHKWFYRWVHASFVEVRANDLIHNFIRIDLAKSSTFYVGKNNDTTCSRLILNNG